MLELEETLDITVLNLLRTGTLFKINLMGNLNIPEQIKIFY